MTRPIEWSDEMDDIIRESVECGERRVDVARELGVSVRALAARMKVLKVGRGAGRIPNPFSRVCVLDAVENGVKNVRQLSRLMGKHYSTVRVLVNRIIKTGLLDRTVRRGPYAELRVSKRWTSKYKDTDTT